MAVSALRRKRRWRRILISALLLTVLFVGGGYLVLTPFFLRLAVLPFLGELIGTELHASEVRISLSDSRLDVRDLTFGNRGKPYLSIRSGSTTVPLRRLILGEFDFENLELSGVVLTLKRTSNGVWNCAGSEPEPESTELSKPGMLSPATEAADGSKSAGEGTERPVEELFSVGMDQDVLDVLSMLKFRRARAENVTFLLSLERPDDVRNLAVRNGRIEIDDFYATGRPVAKVSGQIHYSNSGGLKLESGSFSATGSARLDRNTLPEEFDISAGISDCRGALGGSALNGETVSFRALGGCGTDRVVLRSFALTESQGGVAGSRIFGSGEIVFSPFGCRFSLPEIRCGAPFAALLSESVFGMDPGRVVCDGALELESAPDRLKLSGRAEFSRSGAGRCGNQVLELPDLSGRADFDLAVDDRTRTVEMKQVQVRVAETSGPGRMELDLLEPVSYLWSENGSDGRSARLRLRLTDYPLETLKLASGDPAVFPVRGGKLNGELAVRVGCGLKDVDCSGHLRAAPVVVRLGEREEEAFAVDAAVELGVLARGVAKVRKLSGELRRGDALMGSWKLNGAYNWITRVGRGAFELEMAPSALTASWPGAESQLAAELFPSARGRLTGGFFFQLRHNFLRFDRLAFRLLEGKSVLASVDAPRFGYDFALAQRTAPLRVDYEIPPIRVERFASLLNGLPFAVAGGSVAGRGRVELGEKETAARLSGSVSTVGVTLSNGGMNASPDADLTFDGTLSSTCVEAKTLRLEARENGRRILDFQSDAARFPFGAEERTFSGRVEEGDWTVLNFLCGSGVFSGGGFTGKMTLNRAADGTSGKAAIALELKKMASAQTGQMLSGTFSGVGAISGERIFLDEAKLVLNDGFHQVARLDCVGERKGQNAVQTISLRSPGCDLEYLKNYLLGADDDGDDDDADNGTPAKSPSPAPSQTDIAASSPGEAKSAQPPFTFAGTTLIDCDLKNLTYGRENNVSLKGTVELAGSRIVSRRLDAVLNRSRIAADFLLTGTPDGAYRFECRGGTSDPLEMRPLFQPFVPASLREMRCELRSCQWRLETRFLEPADFAAALDGGVDAEFGPIAVPNSFSKGKVGRVLLLPLDVLPELGRLIPNLERTPFQGFFAGANALRDRTRTIRFTHGKVQLRARKGVLHIGLMRFYGDIIQELAFSGSTELAGEQRLQLKSVVDINGAVVPIEISGSWSDPSVDVRQTVKALIRDNTGAVIENIGSLLKRISGTD